MMSQFLMQLIAEALMRDLTVLDILVESQIHFRLLRVLKNVG